MCIIDVILMSQWNAMVIVLMLYVLNMLKILKYKFQSDEYLNSRREILYKQEHDRYKFVTDRVNEHLDLIK